MSRSSGWCVVAYTQGARWEVASGLSSREAAERALTAILAHDGLTAADASGRRVAVTFSVERAS